MVGFHGWRGKDQLDRWSLDGLGGCRGKPARLFSSFGGNEGLASKEHIELKGGIFEVALFSVVSIIWGSFSISSFCRKGCFGGEDEVFSALRLVPMSAENDRDGRRKVVMSLGSSDRRRVKRLRAAMPRFYALKCMSTLLRPKRSLETLWRREVISSFCQKPESPTDPSGDPGRETPCTGWQSDVLEGCHVR